MIIGKLPWDNEEERCTSGGSTWHEISAAAKTFGDRVYVNLTDEHEDTCAKAVYCGSKGVIKAESLVDVGNPLDLKKRKGMKEIWEREENKNKGVN